MFRLKYLRLLLLAYYKDLDFDILMSISQFSKIAYLCHFCLKKSCHLRDSEANLTVRITDLDKLNLVKLDYGGFIIDSSQCLLLPKLPQKMTLTSSKVFKYDSKIIISIC